MKRGAYYNEKDPCAAQWLRNLIAAGLIADGDVDERSICDVQPDDVKNYVQRHYFAGIGGWSYALRLAGWPDDEEVDTGSCPCQPWSGIGKGLGADDERHLWPELLRLVKGSDATALFGEQVASKAGRDWFSGVRSDLEKLGYEVGGAICALRARGRKPKDGLCVEIEFPWKASRSEPHTFVKEFTGSQYSHFAGWSTPSSRDWKDTPGMRTKALNPDGSIRKRVDQLPRQVANFIGANSTESTVSMGGLGVLNQDFSCWLMGFPVEWELHGRQTKPLKKD